MKGPDLYNEATTKEWDEDAEGFIKIVDSWTEDERVR